MSRLVIGVDPGQTTGVMSFVLAGPGRGRYELTETIGLQVHSADGLGVTKLVTSLIDRGAFSGPEIVLAIEQFVVGKRSARLATPHAGAVARDLIGHLEELGRGYGASVQIRSASQVKLWATDERLEKAGPLSACAQMRHAKDAARHALFAAVHSELIPDPLSSKART